MGKILAIGCILALIGLMGCTHRISPAGQFQGLTGWASTIAWSSDSRLVAAAEGDSVHIWDAKSQEELASTSGYQRDESDYDTPAIAFSPEGRWLAFCGRGGVACLWDFRRGEIQQLRGQARVLKSCAFTRDGKFLVTASGGLMYPSREGPSAARIGRISKPPAAEIEPMTIVVFDVGTGQIHSRTNLPGMFNIAFSSDAMEFAGLRVDMPPDVNWPVRLSDRQVPMRSPRVELHRAQDGDLLMTLEASGYPLMFSEDGKLRSGRHIWDARTGKLIQAAPAGSMIFIDGGKRMLETTPLPQRFGMWPVATVPTTFHIASIDMASGRRRDIGDFCGEGFGRAMENVQGFSPDRQWVLDRQMKLWKVPG